RDRIVRGHRPQEIHRTETWPQTEALVLPLARFRLTEIWLLLDLTASQRRRTKRGYPVAFPPGTHYDTRVVPARRRLARLRYRRLNEGGTTCQRRPKTWRNSRRMPMSRSSTFGSSIFPGSGSISRSQRESSRMICSLMDSG